MVGNSDNEQTGEATTPAAPNMGNSGVYALPAVPSTIIHLMWDAYVSKFGGKFGGHRLKSSSIEVLE